MNVWKALYGFLEYYEGGHSELVISQNPRLVVPILDVAAIANPPASLSLPPELGPGVFFFFFFLEVRCVEVRSI